MEQFVCQRCTACCKGFHAKKLDADVPCFFEKSAMIFLADPGLKILDWEKGVFPKDKVVPCLVFYDLKNEQTIVMNYTVTTDVCPALHETVCTIYNNRPLACRKYPCRYENIHEADADAFSQAAVKNCPAEPSAENLSKMLGLDLKPKISNEEFQKRLFARYGDGFLYGLIADNIEKVHTEFLVSLEKQGLIRLARPGYDMKFLSRKIKTNPSVDVSVLFERHMHLSLTKYLENDYIDNLRKNIIGD